MICQSNMTDAVNMLSKSSIELSEAAASYGALKVIFGAFMVMMFVIVVLFIYQIFQMNKRIVTIGEAAQKTIEYFNPIGSRSIGREEAKAIIRDNVTRTATMLKYGILKIRYENNLTPGSADDRIAGIVTSEYNNRKSFLGRFLVQEKKLSYVCETDDNHTMVELMKEWVYMPKEEFTASLMAQGVNYVLDGIKAKYQDKIDELPQNNVI